MKERQKLLTILPDDVMDQVIGKQVISIGWITEKDTTNPINIMFKSPVPILFAIEELENRRNQFVGCHLLLEDHSVLWFSGDTFLGYDSYEDLQIKSGFYEESGIKKVKDKSVRTFSQNEIDNLLKGDEGKILELPIILEYIPKGWEKYSLRQEALESKRGIYMDDNQGFGAFFVDSTGYGKENEPALTLQEFIKRLKPGFGYGIIDSGRFQVKIGVFSKASGVKNEK